jgi:hypothetical protein
VEVVASQIGLTVHKEYEFGYVDSYRNAQVPYCKLTLAKAQEYRNT